MVEDDVRSANFGVALKASIFNFTYIIINIAPCRGFAAATVTHDEAFQFHSTDNTTINISYRLKKQRKENCGRVKKKEALLIIIARVSTHHFANCIHKYSSITLGP